MSDQELQTIITNYVQKVTINDDKRAKINDKIRKIEAQKERLEEKRHKLRYIFWGDELLQPIVNKLAEVTNRTPDTDLTPCGMQACVTVILNNSNRTNYMCFQFIPLNLKKGEIGILDMTNADQSMGNNPHNLQYPAIPLPKTFQEMIKYSVTEKRETNNDI